jgi:hypothetical protein
MNEEVYVIQTKTGFKKFPIDKRNRFLKDREVVPTMDFLETYHYADEALANSDLVDMGLNTNEYEVKKYNFIYQEVK